MNKVHDLYIDVSHMKKAQIDVKYLNNFFLSNLILNILS
jgi:hypothetical protein